MKLTLLQLNPRLIVKPDKRNEILNNGIDNAYPTRIQRLINASVTAKSCAGVYSRFLTGAGFKDPTLNKIVIGRDQEKNKDITAFELLKQISRELSYYNGVWIHRNINALYETVNLSIVSNKFTRFGKPDYVDYSGKIIVYDNWDKSKGAKIQKKDFHKYYPFNSRKNVIESQIERSGGIPGYPGQVYFHFLDDQFTYPLGMVDVVQNDADTEAQIQQFKNGELRRGFFAKYYLAHDKFENTTEERKFFRDLQTFQGADSGGSTLVMESTLKGEDGNLLLPFALHKIDQNINSNLFKEYERSVGNNIRKAFNNIPPVLIDVIEGKLGGTSGDTLREANDFYNEQTQGDRLTVKEIFTNLFSDWKDSNLRAKDWSIEELVLYQEEAKAEGDPKADAEAEKIKREAQAALKGSVGGVQGILAIQQSVAAGNTTMESAVAIMEEIFGIPEILARVMLGEPKVEGG